MDFADVNPTSIPSTTALNGAIWDTSEWDEADWTDLSSIANWITVYGIGDCATPTIRGSENAVTIRFSAYDMIWQVGNAL